MNKLESETASPRLKSLYRVCGAAAVMAGVLLLFGAINVWLSSFQDNWLVIIFKLHAGFGGVQIDRLNALDFPDIAILALVGVTVLGLYAALRDVSKIWSLIAVVQPWLGLVLFIATKNAGRLSVMGAVLVISVVMLRNDIFNRSTAYMGILAGVLLLVGDFSAGMFHLNIIAIIFGVGYALLITWFFQVARNLLKISNAS
jgi:hypothetical protein